MTEQKATGLMAYEMVSMVVGSRQMHFFSDHQRASARARALQGLVFRVPIHEDYRPRDAAAPLPGWTDVDPWSGTGLSDPPAEYDYNADELHEIEAILIDAGVTIPGVHGVAELIGQRDGYRDRAAELESAAAELGPRLDTMNAIIEEMRHRAETAIRERDDALAHLHQATKSAATGYSHAQALADMPPIARAASVALSGPESLGVEPVVPVPYSPGFTPPDTPWCPPRRIVPELGGAGPVGGYAVGRGLTVPEVPEEERSGGLAFHR